MRSLRTRTRAEETSGLATRQLLPFSPQGVTDQDERAGQSEITPHTGVGIQSELTLTAAQASCPTPGDILNTITPPLA